MDGESVGKIRQSKCRDFIERIRKYESVFLIHIIKAVPYPHGEGILASIYNVLGMVCSQGFCWLDTSVKVQGICNENNNNNNKTTTTPTPQKTNQNHSVSLLNIIPVVPYPYGKTRIASIYNVLGTVCGRSSLTRYGRLTISSSNTVPISLLKEVITHQRTKSMSEETFLWLAITRHLEFLSHPKD